MQNVEAESAVRVSVVIPTLNEARNIPYVLARLPRNLLEVIVVDGRSTDDTVAVATSIRPDLRVVLQDGYGKGNALRCGFRACRGQVIVALDADGSTDAAEIPLFVAALRCGADYVKGSRFCCGARSADITPARRLGNRALTILVNLGFRAHFSDLCYGYTAFWAVHLPILMPDCDGFEVETLLNIRACKAGLRISEVPSYEHQRLHGESNLRALRDGWRVLRTIVRERFTRTPAPYAEHHACRTHTDRVEAR